MVYKKKFFIFIVFIFFAFVRSEDQENKLGEKHFIVIVEGFNCKDFYKKSLDSIFSQVYENYDVIIIDDCSDDGTGKLIQNYIKENSVEGKIREFIINKKQRYKIANLYNVINNFCKDTDIIVEFSLCDNFLNDKVLLNLNKIYSDPNIWLTYGNFLYYPYGEIIDVTLDIPEKIIQENALRESEWAYRGDILPNGCSYRGLTSYYAGLFKLIKKDDLLYFGENSNFKGDFFPFFSNHAVILPMLEMCRNNHFKFLAEFYIMCYKDMEGMYLKTRIVNKESKKIIKDLPKYPSLDFPIWDLLLCKTIIKDFLEKSNHKKVIKKSEKKERRKRYRGRRRR